MADRIVPTRAIIAYELCHAVSDSNRLIPILVNEYTTNGWPPFAHRPAI